MITATETSHLSARLPQIMLEGRVPALPAADVLELGLREGQVVRPAVEVRGQGLTLVLQGREIELGQAWRPLAGQPVTLQVRLLADGSAQLRPPVPLPAGAESAPTPTNPGNAAPAPLLADRLTQLLWRPAQLAGWLSLLQSPELRARGASPSLPIDASLLQALLPQMGSLTGFALRSAVLRSGLFGERSLALAGEGPALPDLKALLRAWQAGLGENQAELRVRLGEAIDDIEAAQLQSVDASPSREMPQSLTLALGFADAPPLRLQIGREGGEHADAAAPWTVNVHSHSDRWGELSLQTRVFPDGLIELTMWADRERVCALAREGARRLADELATAGLRLAGFQVVQGLRPGAGPDAEAPAGRLLDLRA